MLGIDVCAIVVTATLAGVCQNTGGCAGYFFGNNRYKAVTERGNVNVFELLSANGALGVLASGGCTGGLVINDPFTNGVTVFENVIAIVSIAATLTGVACVAVGCTSGIYYGFGVDVLALVAAANAGAGKTCRVKNQVIVGNCSIRATLMIVEFPCQAGKNNRAGTV